MCVYFLVCVFGEHLDEDEYSVFDEMECDRVQVIWGLNGEWLFGTTECLKRFVQIRAKERRELAIGRIVLGSIFTRSSF